MGLFDFFKKKETQKEETQQQKPVPLDTNNIVGQLERAGYFKYAAENDIPELKKIISEGLSGTTRFLDTVYNEDTAYHSKDRRHYILDGETLFEQDGFTDTFKDFEYIFNVIGLKFDVSNHVEEFDDENDWLNHSMTINGKDYVIFKNFKGYGWGEAAQVFAEILNEQLILQGKEERIFLLNGGNDGSAVLMTDEQFAILDPVLTGTRSPIADCRLVQGS